MLNSSHAKLWLAVWSAIKSHYCTEDQKDTCTGPGVFSDRFDLNASETGCLGCTAGRDQEPLVEEGLRLVFLILNCCPFTC